MKGKLQRFWISAMAVAILFPLPCLAEGGGDTKTAGKERPKPVLEEPTLPLSIEARLVRLQKNKNGGVASVVVDASSLIDLDDVTITVKLPPSVRFADGSAVHTQTVKIAAGATLHLPKDLLVGKDGKHFILLEATATTRQGQPIHRGVGFRLLVGAQDPRPPVKDGAIEYKAATDGGV